MIYPKDWPRCPLCGDFALDGHITCGSVECNEGEARRERDRTRSAPPEPSDGRVVGWWSWVLNGNDEKK